MNTRTIYFSAVIAAAAAGLVAWRAHRGAALAWQQAAAADKTREDMAAERDRRLKQISADRKLVSEAIAAPVVAPTRPRPMPARLPPGGAFLAKLKDDPALQAKYLDAKRRKLVSQYAALFRSLQLDPEQIAKLEDAIMDREGQKLDLDFAANKAGIMMAFNGSVMADDPIKMQLSPLRGGGQDSADAVAAHKMSDQISQSFQAAATGILGNDGFSQLQQYESDLPVRNWVNAFNGSLAGSGQTLSPTQVDQLTQTIVGAQPVAMREGPMAAMAQINPVGNLNFGQALSQASSMLSAAQYDALQRRLAEPQASSAFVSGLSRAVGAPAGH